MTWKKLVEQASITQFYLIVQCILPVPAIYLANYYHTLFRALFVNKQAYHENKGLSSNAGSLSECAASDLDFNTNAFEYLAKIVE